MLHPCRVLLVALLLNAALSGADIYTAGERRHWAFQPRREFPGAGIDLFVRAKLRSQGLRPAPPASRRTLVRRAYFDVTGLPPTPEQVERFVRDTRPDAWPRLVDELLASPGYAERWAQHWLDTVRFAESDGFEYDTHRSDAWRYRDYVIRSFAEDKPYGQFVREQLAGDEIDSKSQEMLVATSFHRLGPLRKNAGNQDAAYNRNEELTEMTNVIGSAFLGVTLGCARCHDHKFDPIRQKDYYRMQAFFSTTRHKDLPMYTPAEEAAWKQRRAPVEAAMKKIREGLPKLSGAARAAAEKQLALQELELPAPLPVLNTVEEDPKFHLPVKVLTRGNSSTPEEAVGMRPLGVLLPDGAPEWDPNLAQPRLALANWITDAQHPLTARVMANRIWQHHFGVGLVSTPNDFGRMGTRPSHPELLDWLANQFVAGGYRMKPLHRLILLSETYRQDYISVPSELAKEKDPENRLLWRFPRRRLDAEELRDSMLVVSGKYNAQTSGPSVIVPIEPELVNLVYNPAQWAVNPDAREFYRRSIYLFQKRNLRLPFLEVFDSPDRLLSCARREQSTHAPQALELLNGTFTQEMSVAFAARLDREASGSPLQQVERAFHLALGRAPLPAERQSALRFLKNNPLREFTLALLLTNDFLYVN